ncbi:hypothetical protein BDF14DRAFT_1829857 [Spinellus fusiger]|nr:hypothetical protein BDF14DRAFT_1829857 [Spinellus fusiger]
MAKEQVIDMLGCISGIGFLISGIVSIAKPDERVASICEALIPLLIGVFCLLSLLPIRIGSFELRPIVFQVATQIMPRQASNTTLESFDNARLQNTKAQKMNWLYFHAARFRTDMRIMTGAWGTLLIIGFIVKVVIVEREADISHAQSAGYILFGIIAFLMACFTWIYSTIVNVHVVKQVTFWRTHPETVPQGEGVFNLNWALQAISSAYSQIES